MSFRHQYFNMKDKIETQVVFKHELMNKLVLEEQQHTAKIQSIEKELVQVLTCEVIARLNFISRRIYYQFHSIEGKK